MCIIYLLTLAKNFSGRDIIMRIKLIIFFIAISSTFLRAQTGEKKELDELMKTLARVSSLHPDSVDYVAMKALPIARQLKDIKAETIIQTRRVARILLAGKYDSALTIALQTAKKGEQYPPYIELAGLYYDLSGIYGKNKYPEISAAYIRKGLAIGRLLNDVGSMADGYNRIGVYYERRSLKDGEIADKVLNDSALYYYQLSLDYNTKCGNMLGKSYSLENVAGIFSLRKENQKSLAYLKQSLAIKSQIGDKTALAIINMNIGEAYAQVQNYDSSIYYALKAEELARTTYFADLQQYSYAFLGDIYEKKGDYKTALVYKKRSSAITDSIFTVTSTKQIAELNTKYETEKKENQIKTLNQQSTIQHLKIRQRTISLIVVVVLLIVVVIVAYMVYNRRKLKEQARLQMEINKQQELTAREVIQAEERERRRIAADLHDGVGQLLSASLLNMNGLFQKLGISTESDTLAHNTLALVTESYDELRQISHQMMPNTLLKVGLASAVKDMVLRIDQSKMAISLETIGLNERLDEEVETVLYRVIQESVNNVIKHAGATKLNIQLIKDEDGVSITIEDNGKGFDPKLLKGGIGLKNMQSRVQFHKGTIDIDSFPGKGTLVAVHIPL